MTIAWFVLSLLVLTIGGFACLIGGGIAKRVSYLGSSVSVAGTILSLGPAIAVLGTGHSIVLRLPWQVPMGSFTIAIDPLGALFIVIISLISALAAVYGAGYLEGASGPGRLGAAWCFFNLLQANMLLIVSARNGLLFLMAWEGMSLSSFFLVMFEHEKPAVRKAGWIYLTAAHLGAACLLVLFALLGGDNANLDFDRMAAPSSPLMAGVLFGLAVLGFGAKAGFLPLHVWLPEAHPAAPSHVSAVMSGVMIKTGIYGLVRVLLMLGPPPLWWGWAMLMIGALSGIIGVLYALAQNDLKRMLAYCSVENIGIICLGIGLWLLGVAGRKPELAALGMMGGLLHVCNHAIFKSLLFLGAGAVKQGTHTLVIDHLGGLQKKMPHTARAFLIGAAAICGLPPFNGFVGELFIYLGAFTALAYAASNGSLAVAGMIALLALSLIGALAAACFTKVYGIVFLGVPRSDAVSHAREVPGSMRYPMTALAGLCILLGLGAPIEAALVSPVVAQLLGDPIARAVVASAWPWLFSIGIGGGCIVAITALLVVFRKGLLRGRTITRGPTWDCGYAAPTARMQYTASSFAWPIINMFRWLIRSRVDVRLEQTDFPQQARLVSRTVDLFRRFIFDPLFRTSVVVSNRLHWLQQGRNQFYVLYIGITVLVLLLWKVR